MLKIFAVSDSIGEIAEQVAEAAASQFNNEVKIKRVPYVKTLEDVEEIIKQVNDEENSMIVSTIITVNIREYLTEKAIEKVDLVIEPNSRAIIYLIGRARVTNGVARVSIAYINTATFAFEYFTIINQYPRLEKRTMC